jgi:hypothetical protein
MSFAGGQSRQERVGGQSRQERVDFQEESAK